MTNATQSVSLGDAAVRTLANATKTVPRMVTVTPGWLVHLLAWVPVESRIYRVKKVVYPESMDIQCGRRVPTPGYFFDYETDPREYRRKAVRTILDVRTRILGLENVEIGRWGEGQGRDHH